MLLSAKLAPTFDYPVLDEFWSHRRRTGLPFGGELRPLLRADRATPVRHSRAGRHSPPWPRSSQRAQGELPGHGCDVPQPRGAGEDGGDGRPHQRRTPRLRARRRMARSRAPRLRHRIPQCGNASGDARRGADASSDGYGPGVRHLRRVATTRCAMRCASRSRVQRPHPPIVVGGEKPKMLRVIARHADEWNVPSHGDVAAWAKTSADLDEACAEIGRDPAEIRRSVQLFVRPADEGHLDAAAGDCFPSWKPVDAGTRCCRSTNRRRCNSLGPAPNSSSRCSPNRLWRA